jgi:hypothetical protein
MAEIVRHRISVTTDAGGDATAFTPVAFGRVLQLRYVPDGTSPLDTAADLDITLKESGVVVANHDNIGTSAFTKVYRQATHGIDGSASLYAAGGEPTEDHVFVAGEPIKLVIASGGNAKSGTLVVGQFENGPR